MRTWFLTACVLVALAGTGAGEPVPIDSTRLDSLRVHDHSWSWLGGGNFREIRSCRIEWLHLKPAALTFDPESGTLHIVGGLVDSMNGRDLTGYSFSAVIGPVTTDLGGDSAVPRAAMQVYHRIPIKHPDSVALDVEIKPGDCLAFVPTEEELPDGFSVPMMAADVIRVGELYGAPEK